MRIINKKLLTLLGLFILAISIPLTVYLVKQRQEIRSKADEVQAPKQSYLPYSVPFVGVNYGFHEIIFDPGPPLACYFRYTTILPNYHRPEIRAKVQEQLRIMQDSQHRVQSLRLMIWHSTTAPGPNPQGEHYLRVPSGGGRLQEPYRNNLINLLTDIKNSGIQRLTITPAGNDPAADDFTEQQFEENWSTLIDFRSLAKTYGPPQIRFDLFNEAALSNWSRVNQPVRFTRESDYLRRLYPRYVDRFGNLDISISVIGASLYSPSGTGDPSALQNLITLLNQTGKGLPGWFDLHLYINKERPAERLSDYIYNDLISADEILRRNNLNQPLVIGETYYNDATVAQAMARFMQDRPNRQIEEVMEWPIGFLEHRRPPGPDPGNCSGFSENPPHDVSTYASILQSPTPTPSPTNDYGDNIINIKDYNAFLSCFGERINTVSCLNKEAADLNDDGIVDSSDFLLLFDSFQTQSGD